MTLPISSALYVRLGDDHSHYYNDCDIDILRVEPTTFEVRFAQ
jgi:hypothetical protein